MSASDNAQTATVAFRLPLKDAARLGFIALVTGRSRSELLRDLTVPALAAELHRVALGVEPEP